MHINTYTHTEIGGYRNTDLCIYLERYAYIYFLALRTKRTYKKSHTSSNEHT